MSEQDKAPDEEIAPFGGYYHRNAGAFARILENSPPGTFSIDEIRANHFAAGGVLLPYDLPDLEELMTQPQAEEGETDEHEPARPAGDDSGSHPDWALPG